MRTGAALRMAGKTKRIEARSTQRKATECVERNAILGCFLGLGGWALPRVPAAKGWLFTSRLRC